MPKQQKEINAFNHGIILNADEQDIPIDAAAFSLNVNPNSKDGILSSIKATRLITTVDNLYTRATLPLTWSQNTYHHDEDSPLLDTEYLFVDDISVFEKGKSVSFIGIKGYPEKLEFKYAVPNMERLIVSQPQLGNTSTPVYATFRPEANLTTDDVIIDISTGVSDEISNDTTDNLITYLAEGDYIQFATGTSFETPDEYEILKILSIDTTNNQISVERGMFNSSKVTYSTGTSYHVFVSKISYDLTGEQKATSKGYLVSAVGWSGVCGNHIKGNSRMHVGATAKNLRHTVTGASDQIVFDADAKTMTLTGNTGTGQNALKAGDSFVFYALSSSDTNNFGKRFKILSYNNTVFHLDVAPTTETLASAKTFYFEPSLVKNYMFAWKTGTGVGDSEVQKVNDWYQYRNRIASTTDNWNEWETDDEANVIIQDTDTGLYSDTHLFGAAKEESYYPYINNEEFGIKIGSKFQDSSILTEFEGTFTVDDTIIKLPTNSTAMINKELTWAKGDTIYANSEYMRISKIDTEGIHVIRGLYGTNVAEHSDGDQIYKHAGYEIRQDIDKDLLKSNTEYELTFWAKILTGTAATTTLTCVHDTASNYDEKDFTLVSSAGTIKTYTFETTNAGDGSTDTGDLDEDEKVIIQINGLSAKNDIAEQTRLAITNANGHNGEITASRTNNALALAQLYTGFSGNTVVENELESTFFTCPDFSGGDGPDGIFALEVNGGYFNQDGVFTSYDDTAQGTGYEGSVNIKTKKDRYHSFVVCNEVRGIPSQEENIADNIKWRQLSYRFKTPKEKLTSDMTLFFGNRGKLDKVIGISHVNLCQETVLYNSSKHASFSKSSGFINNKQNKDLVMYDSVNSTLRLIQSFNKDELQVSASDVDSSTTGTIEAHSSLGDATFVSKNREVHIGFGPDKSDSAPKWLGYLNHKIFGQKSEQLYLDSDEIGTYDTTGINNLDKICLAGEWEDVEGAVSGNQLTIDMGTNNTHGLSAGDNIVVREYKDADNSWVGNGVWWVSSITNTQVFVCKRNTDLDDVPGNADPIRVSFRPFYYYGMRRGNNFIYRITPEARVIATSGASSTTQYKGLIEKSQELNFPVESICCSYSKDGSGTDGGHIYALSSFGDKIYRLNVNIKYDEWTSTQPSNTEIISMEYKSFKWSNLRTDGDTGAGASDYVFDSKAFQSTPTIKISGMPSDIIETKGPLSTFDWTQATNSHADVDPNKFDTRLWLQSFPVGEQDTFTDGDRFLFCAKSEYATGDNTVYFADRTPPTVARYGARHRYTRDGDKWGAGPFARSDDASYADKSGNDNMEPGYVASRALFWTGWTETKSHNKIGHWKPLGSFDFETMKAATYQGSEKYSATTYSKPYVNWGYNVGWDGNGSKKTAIKVARYGLFQIADNDGDGLLDGTGVIVPNTANTEVKYGTLGRRLSSHAVGLIGSSELNWIRHAGRMLGNGNSNVEHYTANKDTGEDLNFKGACMHDFPEYMDASKVVFVCTDMHFGDYPQKSFYSVAVAESATDFGAGDHKFYTKCTTTANNYLQPGDLVRFDGTGSWDGWGNSYHVVALDTTNPKTVFYVAELTESPGTAIGTNNSGDVVLGGFSYNRSSSGHVYKGPRPETHGDDIPYHFALNDTNKQDGTIFNSHGGFSRLWYTEQDNYGPRWGAPSFPFETDQSYSTISYRKNNPHIFPAFQNLVEQLNWQSGFMIRPFDMDNAGFSSLLIAEGLSVDMPSYPDAIYHNTNVLKSATGDTGNQLASRLFIASPGEVDEAGELQDSKIFVCEWSFLYPNQSSFIDAECMSHDRDTTSENNGDASEVYFSGTIDAYDSAADSAVGKWDATIHPVLDLDFDDITCAPSDTLSQGQDINPATIYGIIDTVSWASPSGGWNNTTGSNKVHTEVSATSTSGSGTGATFRFSVNSSDTTSIGKYYRNRGYGYAVNDTIIYTDPDSSETMQATVTSVVNDSWYRRKNVLAGLYITVVDKDTGLTQTRKIVGSYSPQFGASPYDVTQDGSFYVSVHYPFSHTPIALDKFYIWKHSLVATAPVRLVKEETLRIDGTSTYSKDPVLSGKMYPQSGTATFDGSTAGLITSDSFHNLTTGDLVSIEGTDSFNDTYSITVKTPKKFQVTTSASAAPEVGTWTLVQNSSSSAANPISTPLNSPAIKMNFGDLDMRKLKNTIVTDSTDIDASGGLGGSGEARVTTSANHELFDGDVVTIYQDSASGSDNYSGTYIIKDKAAATFDIVNTDTTDDTNENNVYTNQWGGIGASTAGSSTVGEIRAGLAQWDKGNIAGNVARYDATDDTRFINITETSVSIKAATITSTTGYFNKNTDYRYKISLIYDGYQEGPLSSNNWSYRGTDSRSALDVQIKVKDFSKRLTSVCLYRKDTSQDLYRLVKQIKTDTGWANNGEEWFYNIQDSGELKATYEARTGISETNRDLSIKYGISCELDGYLFVGNCSHSEIENASNQIFRSKPGKWSIFDWASDFVLINSTPTAMVPFLGKLMVFDKNTIYKINPQNLVIEDIFEGIGCSGKNSVIVTEYSLFFANKQGAYMYDGKAPIKISSIIQSGGDTSMLSLTDSSTLDTNEIDDLSWENTAGNDSSAPPYVTFDSKNNLVYFIVEYNSPEVKKYAQGASYSDFPGSNLVKRTYIWTFSFEKKRWDLWELAKNDSVGKPFIGKDGEVFVSIGNGIFQIQGGSDNLLYTWLSKKLIMGSSSIKKVFNKIKVIGPKQSLIKDGVFETDTDKIIVSTDAGRITSGSSSTTANMVYKSDGTESADYKLKGSNKTAKWLQVKFEEMEEDISATAFIYRLRSIK